MPQPTRDRFDDVPRAVGRVGAHRAEAPGMSGLAVFLWAIVAVVVLVVVGIFAALTMMQRITLFPQSEPTPAATAPPAGTIDTSYQVLVLNATAVDGLDAAVRDIVIGAGWAPEGVIYGAAGQDDFPETVVYYVAEADLAAAQGLATAIGATQVEQSDFYADPANPDLKQLVVVLGADLAETVVIPPETPQADDTPAP